jgi:DNA-binding MarR family transcriptional regulator
MPMNDPAHELPAEDVLLFELNEFLPYRLSLLTNTISAGIARNYRDQHEINVIEWRVLAVLGRYPGLTAKEIGERTAMDKVAISRAVNSLVERELLERVTDPKDRRRMPLQVSPARGRTLLKKIIPLAQTYEQQLLAVLTPQEQKAFSSTLNKLQKKATSLNPTIQSEASAGIQTRRRVVP